MPKSSMREPPMDIDSISAESPANRAKYEKKYDLAPAGAMRMPPAEVKSKVRVAPVVDESARHYKGFPNASKQK